MNSHPWSTPESGLRELLAAVPDLSPCVERALARAEAGMAAAQLRGNRRDQAQPDLFRAALADEFTQAGACIDEDAAGNRNSVVLRPAVDGSVSVVLHVVKQPARGLLPAAGSKSRILEISDSALFGVNESLGCELICLYITWDFVEEGIDLFLSMPRNTSSRGYTEVVWQVRIPTDLGEDVGGSPVRVDIDPDSDVDGIRLRVERTGNGDDPA